MRRLVDLTGRQFVSFSDKTIYARLARGWATKEALT